MFTFWHTFREVKFHMGALRRLTDISSILVRPIGNRSRNAGVISTDPRKPARKDTQVDAPIIDVTGGYEATSMLLLIVLGSQIGLLAAVPSSYVMWSRNWSGGSPGPTSAIGYVTARMGETAISGIIVDSLPAAGYCP